MNIGMLCLCTAGAGAKDTADPVTLARKCESLGFDSFFLSEHPAFPVEVRTPHPVLPVIPESYAYFPDPFVCLAMAAQATSRLKVGAAVILVPERDPIVTAKEVASLDHYCGGRFIFGVGAGWVREETALMGVDFEQRWPITCEYIRAMKELWTRDEASFDGRWCRFPPVRSYPKPRQKPHPPILIGAQGNRALRNVIAVGDGWMPVNYSPAELAAYLNRLRNMCAAAGRDFDGIEITIMRPPEGNPSRLVREYGAAGAHRILLTSDALSLSPQRAERELEELARGFLD
jgi:probable F420-dependent oxidoreductase